ncbi:MAG TPA: VOC family protein [Methylocystis sp.]|nr:VOC family protein [Methylocystis sp.]
MSRPRVAPYLTVSPAAAAIGFYTAILGAKQRALMPAVDGLRIAHCELSINGGSVMLADAFPELGQTRSPMPAEPVTMSVSLEYDAPREIDDICSRASGLGAKIETQPTNSFWGTRFAVFRDPFGHRWILNAPLENKK